MSGRVSMALVIGAWATMCCFNPRAVSAGDELIVPVAAAASTTYTGDPGYVAPQYMIDGSGLNGTGRGATHSNASAANLFWHSEVGIDVGAQWVEFDLGAVYDVTNALVWQLAQQNLIDRGVQTFSISVAGASHVFSLIATGQWLNQATGGSEEPVQVVPLVAASIRYIRFGIQSNWGASGIVGLSEVRFEGGLSAPPPPPPPNVIVPVDVSVSSIYDPIYGPQCLIDGSGLTGTGREATHWNANAANLFWHSDVNINVAAQWIEFDLGAAYDVTNALVWQLAQENNTARGVQLFKVSVAGPDHVYSLNSRDNHLNQATGDSQEPVQVVPLVAKNIQYVRFEIQYNWGAEGIVGLSEVRFEGALSAPPPSDFIILPLGVSASSSYPGWGEPTALTDGSGLTGIGRQATHTSVNAMYLLWHSDGNGVAGQWVEFDLGAAYDVKNALIWQLAQSGLTTRGVKDFSLSVAGPDHVFTTYSSSVLAQASGIAEEPVQVVPLVANKIRYIKLDIQSNYGNQYVGLSEVRFEVAVPELNPAAVTLAPASASASTAYPYMGYYDSRFTIDGSGLTGTGRRATHSNANGWGLFWNSDVGVVTSDQWIEFDLGAVYDVTNALIWQMACAGYTQTGVKGFTIKVAGSDHAFSTYSTGNVLNQASEVPEQFPRVMPLVAKDIRYVRFEIQSNWGRTDGSVGLGEVRFEVAPAETNAFLRTPVACTVDSYYNANPCTYMIDGSGLTGSGLEATHADGLGENSMWLSDYGTVANHWAEFDLGAEFKLVAAAVWQSNQTLGGIGERSSEYLTRGIKSMTIYTAGSNKIYSEYGTVQLNRGLGLPAEPVQLISLKASGVRYVKFAANTSWGDNQMVGLSEVRFLYKRTGTLLTLQ